MASRRVDILQVSAGSTHGWRMSDETLRVALMELGLTVERVALRRPSGGLMQRMRSPGNDLYQAACLVGAAHRGLRKVAPRAIIYSSTHAALLQPRRDVPEAVWIDGPISLMRPGAQNAPIRAIERSRQRRLDLVLSMSLQNPVGRVEALRPRRVAALHSPIDPFEAKAAVPDGLRCPFGVIYAGHPGKGLDVAMEAWRQAAPGTTLVVTGVDARGAATQFRGRVPAEAHFVGRVSGDVHRAIVKAALVYISASVTEQYGRAQLEALSDGVPLATLPSRGDSDQVALAKRLQPNLVAHEMSATALADCISAAINMRPNELSIYRARSAGLLADYSYAAFKQRLIRDVLPTLLP